MSGYAVLVADPPWSFRDALPGAARGAARNYPCLSVDELSAFPLPPIAADALLCLWRVASMQADALHVAQAWGFEPKAELVWEKTTRSGKPHFGMGRLVRGAHEVCLLATRGRFRPASRSVRSRFAAPVGRHSEKPEAFYAIVEQLAGRRPIVELFARRRRRGWSCFGNELREAR
jgi:site-specific DNA-methyltransferase (adenine-specific)